MNSEFVVAVHSLVYLAHTPDRAATSELIACNAATHPARVRRVMGCLRKAGFVEAREGSGGGYALSCDPDAVTLADVYRAMCPGALKPSWESGDPQGNCVVSANMRRVMDRVFSEAERHLESYLSQLTIGRVLRDVRRAADG